MTTAEVLRAAADVIRERGWFQGDWESQSGEVCVLGSVRVAREALVGPLPYESDEDFDAQSDLWSDCMTSICDALQIEQRGIANWNDARGRTADEVIAALLKAAELAESRA